jgi:hypothetical protein
MSFEPPDPYQIPEPPKPSCPPLGSGALDDLLRRELGIGEAASILVKHERVDILMLIITENLPMEKSAESTEHT